MKPLFFAVIAAAWASLAAAQVELSWGDNSDNEDGFQIERREAEGPWLAIARVDADATTYTDTATRLGVEYAYRVAAWNEWGFSGYTNTATSRRELPPLDEIEQPDPPADPGPITAADLARGLEAFAGALREGSE